MKKGVNVLTIPTKLRGARFTIKHPRDVPEKYNLSMYQNQNRNKNLLKRLKSV